MIQRREHRLRNLEKQNLELAAKIASQNTTIDDMQYALLRLQRRVYGKSPALPRLPWYKRLFRQFNAKND